MSAPTAPSAVSGVTLAGTVAASASLADVSAAIALASPGDTVCVPAGTATWNGNLDFWNWKADLVLTRGISLVGAGIGLTNITFTSAYGIGYAPSSSAFTNNDRLRISGFTFSHAANSTWGYSSGQGGAICLYGYPYASTLQNRIDHCRFVSEAGAVINAQGNMQGVADNCEFVYTSNAWRAYLFLVSATSGDRSCWDSVGYAVPGHPFGQADQFYIEDSTIDGPMWCEAGQGGRYAVRHNLFTNDTEFDMFDAHGNQPDTGNYATVKVEIYDNVFTGLTKSHRLIAARGGKSLVYNNTLTGTSQVDSAFLNSYEENNDYLSPVNDASVSVQYPNDCYFFANTKNGVRFTDVTISGTFNYTGIGAPQRVVPQKDLDLFWEQAGTFTGASGVGVGLIAERPVSGLTVGVGYWATDESVLYRATGSAAWEVYYTPYTYPHPLREG
ncbi:MAG: hypothetical protein MUF84_12065 [Anaerolineae bacterium]|jgi:hypothetical protein|nr:hypothetical protein [Anaerolineae bacterium]